MELEQIKEIIDGGKGRIIYLASPYTHEDPDVRRSRYRTACEAAAWLMRRGDVVFCPVAHSHAVSVESMLTNPPPPRRIDPCNREFWLKQDLPILALCSELCILAIPGFAMSKGIQAEVAAAIWLSIPVTYLFPTSKEGVFRDSRTSKTDRGTGAGGPGPVGP